MRQILEEAKRLKPIERAELLEQLFSTFELTDPTVDAAWAAQWNPFVGNAKARMNQGGSLSEVAELWDIPKDCKAVSPQGCGQTWRFLQAVGDTDLIARAVRNLPNDLWEHSRWFGILRRSLLVKS